MKKTWRRVLLLLSVLTLCLGVAAAALPSPTESFYVGDFAGVLSPAAEKQILALNDRLYPETGAELVVVTVDFLDGKSIENYAYQLFNDWEIGQKGTNRGVLLLLAIGEENYWVTTGTGLERILSAQVLDDLLWNHLEEDFDQGDYESGVLEVTEALAERLESALDGAETPQEDSPGENMAIVFFLFLMIVGAVVVLSVLGTVARRTGGWGPAAWFFWPRRHYRYPHYRRPPPPPGPGGFHGPGGFGGFGGAGRRPGGGGHAPRGGGGGFSRGGGAGRRGR